MVLLFFKYYDPTTRQIHYAGHHYALIKRPLADLVPILLQRAGLPPHTQLELYEEVNELDLTQELQVIVCDFWNCRSNLA